MTQVQISNRLLRDFGMVPNALWAAPLPLAAKAVAAYLLSLRDGAAMPYVAEIEATLGIGRDARRRAFEALEAVGFLSWELLRDDRGTIRRKSLVLDPFAFDRPAVVEPAAHAPESQAHGADAASGDHAPDLPAGGFSVPPAVDRHRCRGDKSGGLLKTKEDKKARAALARRSVQPRRAQRGSGGGVASAAAGDPCEVVSALTAFERSRLARGASVMIGGQMVTPGTAQFSALASALAASGAGL